ncbi:MAG: radical SAM protein, partial [Synergistaceae bacterium]|nr:radical SAM protein [Synergistaceae bacterium]
MVNISRLLRPEGAAFPGDALRYGPVDSRQRKPVIVWHLTGECNLRCRHCYASGIMGVAGDPMDMNEASRFMDLLASWRPPALLLSGGEPLMHGNFFSYAEKLRRHGINISVSTNGTLIDDSRAKTLSDVGVSYAGVSLDGPRDVHDAFRGKPGAFDDSVRGIERLAARGCRVGLRVTLAAPVLPRLGEILDLAGLLPISRICFYHFIPSGRGAADSGLAPAFEDERRAVGDIIEWAEQMSGTREKRVPLEVLTVGDASDGVLLYRRLMERDADRASGALGLLRRSAARMTGEGILSVRWDGLVFPNQFEWDKPRG